MKHEVISANNKPTFLVAVQTSCLELFSRLRIQNNFITLFDKFCIKWIPSKFFNKFHWKHVKKNAKSCHVNKRWHGLHCISHKINFFGLWTGQTKKEVRKWRKLSATYNSFPISADTGLEPAVFVLESAGEACLPEANWDGLTNKGDEPRRPAAGCDWLDGLLVLDLGGGVFLKKKKRMWLLSK